MPCGSEALVPVSVEHAVDVCLCVRLDSERWGPVFLYEGFDHSAKADISRHPEVQNTKPLDFYEYSERRLKKMTAEEKVRAIAQISIRASNIGTLRSPPRARSRAISLSLAPLPILAALASKKLGSMD
jgi:hypothetical protein